MFLFQGFLNRARPILLGLAWRVSTLRMPSRYSPVFIAGAAPNRTNRVQHGYQYNKKHCPSYGFCNNPISKDVFHHIGEISAW